MAKDYPPLKREVLASESDDDSVSDASSDEVEDEDGEELTPALDAAILRTLAKIKRKEGVYGGEAVLAAELLQAEASASKLGLRAVRTAAQDKPFLLKDLHRKNLLDGVQDDDEDSRAPITNVEAARRARAEALSAFGKLAASDDEDDDDDAGLVKRQKDVDELEEDEEEYRRFLLEMGGGEDEVRRVLGMGDQPVSRVRESSPDAEAAAGSSVKKGKTGKKSKKADVVSAAEREEMDTERSERKAKADEDFLMNYILNRGWIDKSAKHVPTYDEITARVKVDDATQAEAEDAADGAQHPWGELADEDEFDDKAEEFETAYNFRFEEPGSSTITTHPRNIDTLVRREDDSRKLKRAAKAERKAAERAANEEETRRRKGEKRREAEGLMASLRSELGESGMDWEAVERLMEGDYEEAQWERVVGDMLARKAEIEDDEKPTWSDDGDDADFDEADLNEEDREAQLSMPFAGADGGFEEETWDDGPVNMDADFADEPQASKKSRRQKKKDRYEQKLASQTEVAIADLTVAEKAAKVKQAVEDYRALDHEDMIGDLPTRFKYTRGPAASFGLTPAEILLATDAELNTLVSLNHVAPYRKNKLGFAAVGLGKRVRELRGRLASRKWGEEDSGDGAAAARIERPRDSGYAAKREGHVDGEASGGAKRDKSAPTKRLGAKQRKKAKAAALAVAGGDTAQPMVAAIPVASPLPSKRKREEHEQTTGEPGDGEPAGGESGEAKKRKRRHKRHSKKAVGAAEVAA